MQIDNIDYFVWSCESAPRFIVNSTPVHNGKILKLLKAKKATFLYRYFTIHFDSNGKEVVSCKLPPAFEVFILTQIKDAINGLFLK